MSKSSGGGKRARRGRRCGLHSISRVEAEERSKEKEEKGPKEASPDEVGK